MKEITLKEEWKDIKDYEGYYQVSDLGKIRSVDRFVVHSKNGNKAFKKGKVFAVGFTNKALIVALSKNGIKKSFLIYRIVAQQFIPNPENKPEVNHKDGNRLNNKVSNLEWMTRSENEKHAYDTGLYTSRKGIDHPMSITNESDVIEMRKLYNEGVSKKQLATDFKMEYSNVCKIIKRKAWVHI